MRRRKPTRVEVDILTAVQYAVEELLAVRGVLLGGSTYVILGSHKNRRELALLILDHLRGCRPDNEEIPRLVWVCNPYGRDRKRVKGAEYHDDTDRQRIGLEVSTDESTLSDSGD